MCFFFLADKPLMAKVILTGLSSPYAKSSFKFISANQIIFDVFLLSDSKNKKLNHSAYGIGIFVFYIISVYYFRT